MLFHEKLKTLRLEKEWSQSQLAERLGTDRMRISTYERGKVVPETRLLIKIAEVFNVSLDYLVFDNEHEGPANIDVKDRNLLKNIERLDKLDEKSRRIVNEMIDLLVVKDNIKQLVNKD